MQLSKTREIKMRAKSSAFLHLFPRYCRTSSRVVMETVATELPIENHASAYFFFLKGLGIAKEQMLSQNGLRL